MFGLQTFRKPVFSHVVRALAAFAISVSLADCAGSSAGSLPATASNGGSLLNPTTTQTTNEKTRYGHVFVVLLENKNESVTYSSTGPAYLNNVVKPAGVFVPGYYGTGHASLDNYISLISGQAPNVLTTADCPYYLNFVNTTTLAYGQAAGSGCVFPTNVPNIADQFRAANIPWRGYMEDMGNDPTREAGACGHPALNAQDLTQEAEGPSAANNMLSDQYATRHNPFMYFHSIIDDQAYCQEHVVNASQLPIDLQSVATTPNYVFYTPNLCNDGHDSGCVSGQPGNYTGINTEMQYLVPLITGSPAFKQDGLLVIIFDEADTSDTSSCCGEMPGPLDPDPGEEGGTGGGQVGAVFLSPFIAPGTTSTSAYNHYSLLASIEDIFGFSHIGYATQTFAASIPTDPTVNTADARHRTDVYRLVTKGR
jgi:hypothetical protein